jgi:hypothetical protein
MVDVKVILALALLLSTLQIATPKPGPAGGIPIPNHGITNAQ